MESKVDSSKNSDRGFIGGVQAGYSFIDGNLMYGVETDIDLNSADPDGDCKFANVNNGHCDFSVGPMASLRGRAGYASGDLLIFATGGVVGGRIELDTYGHLGDQIDNLRTFGKFGWTAGAGVEYLLGDMVSVKMEYRYAQFFDADFDSNAGAEVDIDMNYHAVITGVNWHF